MMLLVFVALIGGFLTTFAIVKRTALNQRALVRSQLAGYQSA